MIDGHIRPCNGRNTSIFQGFNPGIVCHNPGVYVVFNFIMAYVLRDLNIDIPIRDVLGEKIVIHIGERKRTRAAGPLSVIIVNDALPYLMRAARLLDSVICVVKIAGFDERDNTYIDKVRIRIHPVGIPASMRRRREDDDPNTCDDNYFVDRFSHVFRFEAPMFT